ncbi:MAG: hypothetical protein ACLGHX_04875 [Acidimicrobiia bacterium]
MNRYYGRAATAGQAVGEATNSNVRTTDSATFATPRALGMFSPHWVRSTTGGDRPDHLLAIDGGDHVEGDADPRVLLPAGYGTASRT